MTDMLALEQPTRTNRAAPSRFVMEHLHGAPKGGAIADIACGTGRHTRVALQQGYSVIAIDKDPTAVANDLAHPQLTALKFDLERGAMFPLRPGTCGGVLITDYLHRPLFQALADAVRSDGILIYETEAVGRHEPDRRSERDRLLRPGELLNILGNRLIPIRFEHARSPDRRRVVSRLLAVGRDHKWVRQPPVG